MSDIQNLQTYDPFRDTEEDDFAAKQQNYVHLRVQQRNGRKCVTTVQGLPEQIDLKKLLKAFKKEFNCNGTIVEDEELGNVIQLSGDQRQKISEFLIAEELAKKENLKIHGV